jgi:hypothetical protein
MTCAACDCADTLDVIERVDPPVPCIRFDPTVGNQCRSPHLRGMNACNVPLVIADEETVPPGADFDHVVDEPEAFRHTVHARSGATDVFVILRQEAR